MLKVKIHDIVPHPNADNLEIAKILGFQTIVAKNKYEIGQEVLFYEPELAFTIETAKSYGIDRYLYAKTDSNYGSVLVIKEIRLRGELSEGLILPEQIAHFKFTPPVNIFSKTPCLPENGLFKKYGSLENLRKVPNIFEENSQVLVTEKIHGTNSRVGFYKENNKTIWAVGSRALTRELNDPLYSIPLSLKTVKNLLESLEALGYTSATLYGELYGPKIQNYSYGENSTKYVAFTLNLNGEIVNPDVFQKIMKSASVPCAPIIYSGPYSYEKIKELSEGPSILGTENTLHKREGVVVQQNKTIAKLVSDTYLLKQKISTTDL